MDITVESPAVAEIAETIPEVLECFPAMVEGIQIFLCAQEFSPEAWEALMNVQFVWGAMMGTPVAKTPFPAQGGSAAQGGHAEYSPGAQGFFTAQGRWPHRIFNRGPGISSAQGESAEYSPAAQGFFPAEGEAPRVIELSPRLGEEMGRTGPSGARTSHKDQ